jgi:hypothetical protein
MLLRFTYQSYRPTFKLKASFYKTRIAQLEEKLTAVKTDLESVLSEEGRIGLEKRAEVLLRQIEAFKVKLSSL